MINLQNWGLIRIVRLAAGGIVVWNALGDHQLLLGLMGGFFLIQALLNTGCGASGCAVSAPKKRTQKLPKDVDYEEVY